MRQLLSPHETHVTSTHCSYNLVPPTTRLDGFVWTITSSCCCNARSTRFCNTVCRANITPVQAVIFCRRRPRYNSRSAHPRFEIETHEGERHCNFRSEDVPCLGLLREVTPGVPSAGRTRARTSCRLRRQTALSVVCTPTTVRTF